MEQEQISAKRIAAVQDLARNTRVIDHADLKSICDMQDKLARMNGQEIRDAVQGLNKDERGRLFWILANVENFDTFMEYLKDGICNPWKEKAVEQVYAEVEAEYKTIADELDKRGKELNERSRDLWSREAQLEQRALEIEHEAAIFQIRLMQNNGKEIRDLRHQIKDLTSKLSQERAGNRKGRMMLKIASKY